MVDRPHGSNRLSGRRALVPVKMRRAYLDSAGVPTPEPALGLAAHPRRPRQPWRHRRVGRPRLGGAAMTTLSDQHLRAILALVDGMSRQLATIRGLVEQAGVPPGRPLSHSYREWDGTVRPGTMDPCPMGRKWTGRDSGTVTCHAIAAEAEPVRVRAFPFAPGSTGSRAGIWRASRNSPPSHLGANFHRIGGMLWMGIGADSRAERGTRAKKGP